MGVADLNGWNFKQRVHYVRAHVIGAARSWFLSQDFVSWHDFETKFREAFLQEIRLSDRWNKLKQRNQELNEHLVDYFYEKVRLCRVLKLPFTEIRDHMIQGLRSGELASYANMRWYVHIDRKTTYFPTSVTGKGCACYTGTVSQPKVFRTRRRAILERVRQHRHSSGVSRTFFVDGPQKLSSEWFYSLLIIL
uniref:Retrotransposon gag domain-containing protein n=1 Tax=Schizaphis graminum TaxID=13262 RepID=A0A2S2N6X8_SCHGA